MMEDVECSALANTSNIIISGVKAFNRTWCQPCHKGMCNLGWMSTSKSGQHGIKESIKIGIATKTRALASWVKLFVKQASTQSFHTPTRS